MKRPCSNCNRTGHLVLVYPPPSATIPPSTTIPLYPGDMTGIATSAPFPMYFVVTHCPLCKGEGSVDVDQLKLETPPA